MRQRSLIVILLGLLALALMSGCSLRRRIGGALINNPTQAPTAETVPTAAPTGQPGSATATSALQAEIPTAIQAARPAPSEANTDEALLTNDIQKSLDDLMKSLNSTDTLKDIQ
jgi:hypothetical protein